MLFPCRRRPLQLGDLRFKAGGICSAGQPSSPQLPPCPMTDQLGAHCLQALHDAYGGWLHEKSVADFAAYAEVLFKALGHRVTNWSTFNEPWTFVEVRQGHMMLLLDAQAAAGALGLPNHMSSGCHPMITCH